MSADDPRPDPDPADPEWFSQPGHGWYDPDGRPISAQEAMAYRSEDARRVGYTLVRQPDGTQREVSTVFLGFDVGMGPAFGYPPVLWETAVFVDPSSTHVLDTVRYTSRAAAECGHRLVVAALTPSRVDLARYRRIVAARRVQAQRARRRARRLTAADTDSSRHAERALDPQR